MEKRHFENLRALGAGDFAHLNGPLEAHLTNTWKLLKQWQASDILCTAGLYHAAYGTDGFVSQMVTLKQRQEIVSLIGEETEAIVYLYCSCDRQYTFERVESGKPIEFKDRFTGSTFLLSQLQAGHFCELTAANELELCIADDSFNQQHGAGLFSLFKKMEHYLSEAANIQINEILTRFKYS